MLKYSLKKGSEWTTDQRSRNISLKWTKKVELKITSFDKNEVLTCCGYNLWRLTYHDFLYYANKGEQNVMANKSPNILILCKQPNNGHANKDSLIKTYANLTRKEDITCK